MPTFRAATPITAVVYTDGRRVDAAMRTLADYLKQQGLALSGFVQVNQSRAGRTRCDMILEELSSGKRIAISEDRGAEARGCMLDMSELLRASTLAATALARQPNLLMINKFGKTEANGGGFRALIADALAREIPIIIAVPENNLPQWQTFAADLTINHDLEALPGAPQQMVLSLGFATEPTSAQPIDERVAATAT